LIVIYFIVRLALNTDCIQNLRGLLGSFNIFNYFGGGSEEQKINKSVRKDYINIVNYYIKKYRNKMMTMMFICLINN